MKSLWGRSLSDEEIVARARKQIGKSWRDRVFMFCVALAMAGLAAWVGTMFLDFVIDGLKDSGAQWRWFYFGLSTGVTAAMIFTAVGYSATCLLFISILSLYDQRDRLLVRYHDELHAKRD